MKFNCINYTFELWYTWKISLYSCLIAMSTCSIIQMLLTATLLSYTKTISPIMHWMLFWVVMLCLFPVKFAYGVVANYNGTRTVSISIWHRNATVSQHIDTWKWSIFNRRRFPVHFLEITFNPNPITICSQWSQKTCCTNPTMHQFRIQKCTIL